MKIPISIGVTGPRCVQPQKGTISAAEPKLERSSQPQDSAQLNLLQSTRRPSSEALRASGSKVSFQLANSAISSLPNMILGITQGKTETFPKIQSLGLSPSGSQSSVVEIAFDAPTNVVEQSQLTLYSPTQTGNSANAPTVIGALEAWSPPQPEEAPLSLVRAAQTPALNPAQLDCPEEVLEKLRQSQRTLIVCHTPPDGDTVGSALGLSRLLKSLGEDRVADICLDDDCPSWLREQSEPGEITGYPEVENKDYDLVVLCDVAQAHRIGRAKHKLMTASDVLIIDHHLDQDPREKLGLMPEAQLTKWIAPSDATGVQVATIAERLAPAQTSAQEWKAISSPLLTALSTDVGFFKNSGVRPESSQVYSHLLSHRSDSDVDAAYQRTRTPMPAEVLGLLEPRPTLRNEMLSEGATPLRSTFQGLTTEQMYSEELAADLSLIRVPLATRQLALEVAELAGTDDLNVTDIDDPLFRRLDTIKNDSDLAVMLLEHEDHVQVCVRSQDKDRARELALSLGGGGKAHMAGAQLKAPLQKVEARIKRWLQEN